MSLSKPRAAVLFLAVAAASAGAAPPAERPAPGPAERPAPGEVVTTEPIHAIVLPMKGSYAQHQAAFERLSGFLAGRGASPTGAPFARYFSDPSAVGEADLAWEVGFPVGAAVKAEPPFEIRDLPATLAAVRIHAGPWEELEAAWGAFIQSVLGSGHQPVGPAMQVFRGDLATNPQVEMRMPVAKAGPVEKAGPR